MVSLKEQKRSKHQNFVFFMAERKFDPSPLVSTWNCQTSPWSAQNSGYRFTPLFGRAWKKMGETVERPHPQEHVVEAAHFAFSIFKTLPDGFTDCIEPFGSFLKRGYTPNHPFIDGFSMKSTIQLCGYSHIKTRCKSSCPPQIHLETQLGKWGPRAPLKDWQGKDRTQHQEINAHIFLNLRRTCNYCWFKSDVP